MARYIWHNIPIELTRKKIKNLHLCVHYATGEVRISAPQTMDLKKIRDFVATKKHWIVKHRARIGPHTQKTLRFIDGEIHPVFDGRFPLKIVEHATPNVFLHNGSLEVHIQGRMDEQKVHRALTGWYRKSLFDAAGGIISKWKSTLGVSVKEIVIRAMKTKWGTCKPSAAKICLNLELARRKKDLVEFVIVHELVHLVERRHNERFKRILTSLIPNWKKLRKELNSQPAF